MLTTPIFTRLLTTEEYGNYSVFYSWLGIVSIFVTLNMFYGVYTQGLIKYSDEKHIFASSLQGLTLSLTVAWTVVYLCFHNFWNALFGLTTVQMLAMLLMIWTTAVFQYWSAEQRVEYKYIQIVCVTAIVSLAKPVVGILFVILAEDKVTARILGLALVEVVGYFGLFVAQMRKGKFFSKKYWLYALKFNIPLVPHYLSQSVLGSSDRIMIKQLVDSQSAGIYSLAYSISQIMLLFNTALGQTISPWMYNKIKTKQLDTLANIAYISMGIVGGLNLLLIAVAPELVAIFAPQEYYEAIWVIPPIAMSCYFMFCYDFFARFEFYYEKTKFIMGASILGALLNIVLNYIFINQYGYIAAGYTTLVCYILYVALHYFNMRKICREEMKVQDIYDIRKLLVISLTVCVFGFIFMFTYSYLLIRYMLIFILMGISIWKRQYIWEQIKMLTNLKKQM